MQTALIRIKFTDGREYRVFCANKAQIKKVHSAFNHDSIDSMKTIENGIHTIKQWEQIVANLNK